MEEIEKQVEEYCKKECGAYYYECHRECSSIEAFQSGAKWGIANAIQWHDLRKNSNDLPKEVNKFIIIALYNCITEEIITTVGTYEEFGNMLIGNVIAWCELPQFKE